MIDQRMDGVPAAEGPLFARCSPPPLCSLSSSSSSNSNSSSSDSSPHHSGKAHRELTFPPFPSFAASSHSAGVSSPPFAPRLVSAGSLSFQSSNPFILPFSSSTSPSSSTSTSSSSSPTLSSSSSSSSLLCSNSTTAPPSASVFGGMSFPALSRLYSGASLSGSSDTDGGLVEASYLQPFSSGDFTFRLPSANCDGPLTLTVTSGPSPPLGLVSLSVSRSISSTSASSALSLVSPRVRRGTGTMLGGGEREDGALSAAANSDSSSSSGTLWHCSYGCGKVYRKSSGRSIRRHVVSCFKANWPGGAELSESELSSLIALQQDRGLLVTGLRRWKMRQSRRPANELTESEKWRCPWNCGKFYRSTSSRSIQRHATTCPNRAAEQGLSPAGDMKRVKRQRDEGEQGDEDGEQSGEERSDSEGDNDEAEETTDSSGSARSGNVRMRATVPRSGHTLSSSNVSNKAALRSSTQLALSSASSSPSSATLTAPRPTSQPATSAAFVPQDDVDFLYPDSTTNTPPSSTSAAAASAPSYDVLSSQKREVALQLQRLLRDIHRRHGTNHPVFQSPMMTQQLIDGLLNKDVDDAVDDMNSEQQHNRAPPSLTISVAAGDTGSSSSASSSTSVRGSWVDSNSLLSPSASSVSSGPSTPCLSSAALHWTCACGSSFKITSSKSIQKHRASCDTHQATHKASHKQQQQQQQQPTHEPRVKREKH